MKHYTIALALAVLFSSPSYGNDQVVCFGSINTSSPQADWYEEIIFESPSTGEIEQCLSSLGITESSNLSDSDTNSPELALLRALSMRYSLSPDLVAEPTEKNIISVLRGIKDPYIKENLSRAFGFECTESCFLADQEWTDQFIEKDTELGKWLQYRISLYNEGKIGVSFANYLSSEKNPTDPMEKLYQQIFIPFGISEALANPSKEGLEDLRSHLAQVNGSLAASLQEYLAGGEKLYEVSYGFWLYRQILNDGMAISQKVGIPLFDNYLVSENPKELGWSFVHEAILEKFWNVLDRLKEQNEDQHADQLAAILFASPGINTYDQAKSFLNANEISSVARLTASVQLWEQAIKANEPADLILASARTDQINIQESHLFNTLIVALNVYLQSYNSFSKAISESDSFVCSNSSQTFMESPCAPYGKILTKVLEPTISAFSQYPDLAIAGDISLLELINGFESARFFGAHSPIKNPDRVLNLLSFATKENLSNPDTVIVQGSFNLAKDSNVFADYICAKANDYSNSILAESDLSPAELVSDRQIVSNLFNTYYGLNYMLYLNSGLPISEFDSYFLMSSKGIEDCNKDFLANLLDLELNEKMNEFFLTGSQYFLSSIDGNDLGRFPKE